MSRRFVGSFLAIALVVVALDQGIKIWVLASLSPQVSYPFFGELLKLYLTFNDSAAFSIGFGATWIFTILSSLAVLALLWFGPKVKTRGWAILAGVLLGGVTGNLIDRLTRAPGFPSGQVVDYLQIPLNFPIFNLADICIVTSTCLAALAIIRGQSIGGSKPADTPADAPTDAPADNSETKQQ